MASLALAGRRSVSGAYGCVSVGLTVHRRRGPSGGRGRRAWPSTAPRPAAWWRTTRGRAAPTHTPPPPGRAPRRAARGPARSGTGGCRLESKLDRGEVGLGDDAAVGSDNRALWNDGRERRIGRAGREQLLEPGIGHDAFEGDGVEQPQQHPGAPLTRPVQALGGRPEQLEIDAPAAGIGQRPTDEPAIVDVRRGCDSGDR
jgi:hypothetical protein